ncbi:hypothetical protein [Microcoleus sp. bin38.metabat.b11b12b14.051]|uniref:hypothetical protein n=1 Tax=Microcoleus sp. bin38.metabat.b11b12b14.051 TaxID=2742709 RepID=UPI0025E0F6C8|nr:hypothetical protein [Microcoleus sp. bin38.metabat.b11b12b14.051]
MGLAEAFWQLFTRTNYDFLPKSFAPTILIKGEISKHKFPSHKSITQNSVNVADSWGWAKHLGNYSPAQFMIFRPNASPQIPQP